MSLNYQGWHVIRTINSGSYGTVYEIARNDRPQIHSALKKITIPENQSEILELYRTGMDETGVRRYYAGQISEIVREIQVMVQLKGKPNIVRYQDHKVIPHRNQIGWDIYIRMELLVPVETFFQRNGCTRRDVIRLGLDVCRALENCEAQNIIHRDIKPGNILVDGKGNFKLGDFGIARQMDTMDKSLTQARGSENYMAAEVLNSKQYDLTADIYSLGLVLYRLANDNRLPFLPPYPQNILHEDAVNALNRRLNGEKIPAPCNGDEELSAVILKACSYEPFNRYSSAVTMKKDLEVLYREYSEDAPDGKKIQIRDNEQFDKTWKVNPLSSVSGGVGGVSNQGSNPLNRNNHQNWNAGTPYGADPFSQNRYNNNGGSGAGGNFNNYNNHNISNYDFYGPRQNNGRKKGQNQAGRPYRTQYNNGTPYGPGQRNQSSGSNRGQIPRFDQSNQPDPPKKEKGWILPVVMIICALIIICGGIFSMYEIKTAQTQDDQVSGPDDTTTKNNASDNVTVTVSSGQKESEKKSDDSSSDKKTTPTPTPTEEAKQKKTEKSSAAAKAEETDEAAMITIYGGIQAPASDFNFPNSSTELLTEEDLAFLDGEDIDTKDLESQLIIDEIYVRYGYTFTTDKPAAVEARKRYGNKDWYKEVQAICPESDSYLLKQNYMNEIERANIKMLCDWQNANHAND